MTLHQSLRHTQLATYPTHLVLEQPFQWLAQLKVHLLWQTTHIVVTLNHLASDVQTLNTVGIDSTLCQPLGIFYLTCLGIKHFNKVTTYDLTLGFRISSTFQVGKELLAGIHTNYIQTQTFIGIHHLGKLILAQHAMIHEDASKVLAYSTVQQGGTYTRIHTPTQTQYHSVVAQLFLQFLHSGLHKRSSAPLLPTATDIHHEVLQQLETLQRVMHLRMILHRPNPFVRVGVCRILYLFGRCYGMKAFRQLSDGITMTHPHLRILFKALEQWVRGLKLRQMGTPILTATCWLHLTSIAISHQLGSVANAQYRIFAYKLREVHFKSILVIDGIRRTA